MYIHPVYTNRPAARRRGSELKNGKARMKYVPQVVAACVRQIHVAFNVECIYIFPRERAAYIATHPTPP